jgi:hypothetical protein
MTEFIKWKIVHLDQTQEVYKQRKKFNKYTYKKIEGRKHLK